MKRRSEPQPDAGRRRQDLITHVHRVLQVRQQHPLFHLNPADFVTPDRQSRLQPKFGEGRHVRLERRVTELERVKPHDAAILELEFFGKMV